MRILSATLIAAIAALHFYIAWFEIFAWTTYGPKVFDVFPTELFAQTTQLAANQGLYNAFLAVGLTWSLCISDPIWRRRIAACFLLFVLAAGLFAAATVALRPGLFQIVPASAALLLVFLGSKPRER
ncbi:MAG: DUF1304 domain-containing protein [Pseudomonadota bacterium]